MKTKLLILALAVGLTTGCPPTPVGPNFEDITVRRAVFFGDGECRIGIEPGLPGLTEVDPVGFRLWDGGDGGRLLFGPTEMCTVEVNPQGPAGLLFSDPNGFRLLNPVADDVTLFFGPTDLCAIKIRPQGADGLWLCDPAGARIVNPLGEDLLRRLAFGETDQCTIEVDPAVATGLLLRDPNGIRIMPNPFDDDPIPPLPFRLFFGPTDLCSIQVDPAGPDGLLLYDPAAIRVCNPNENEPVRLVFGPDDLCRIELDPLQPGLRLLDPFGVRVVDPDGTRPRVTFGLEDDCFIEAQPQLGIRINDPIGLLVTAPELVVEGIVVAQAFTGRDIVMESSRELKKNIQPINNALATITRLEGVRFEWTDGPEGRSDIGFVAEDVAQVLPEVVVAAKDGKAEGLKYSNMVAVAVEGIKEQQHQIETLHEENRVLKQNLDAVQQQLAEMARVLAALQAQ
jgi:hypothetical protein